MLNHPSGSLAAAAILFCMVFTGGIVQSAEPFLDQQDLFESGTEGYKIHRIPAIVVTNKGTILAFCEGHKLHMFDSGDIDIVMKRSFDGGKTWGPLQTVWDDGQNACGGPTSVVDRDTGTIWLFPRWNHGADWQPELQLGRARDTFRSFVRHSTDDGATWSEPVELTDTVKKPEWRFWGQSPGTGIQLEIGANKGRLVIPCCFSSFGRDVGYDGFREVFDTHADHQFGSCLIFSDDHGKTWERSKGVAWPWMTECHVVELSNGDLMLNFRQAYRKKKVRAYAVSGDGGATWSEPVFDDALPDPYCQGSFIRYTRAGVHDRNRLLHANAANPNHRKNMTVRLSYDEGRTWPVSKVVEPEGTQYSSMTVLPDMTICLLYEAEPYKFQRLARFNLEWLTDEQDSIQSAQQAP
jgi:sialidase-1